MIRRVLQQVCSRQFIRYVCIGLSTNALDFAMYYTLIFVGCWYLYAQIITGTISFIVTFFAQRHFAFSGQKNTANHFVRFCILDIANTLIITFILYALVEWCGITESIAKIPANGSVVLWNFFLYKFFVYR